MISKDVAYEMGIAANVTAVTGQVSAQAGLALSTWAIKNHDSFDAQGRKVISRVLDALATVGKVSRAYDVYSDPKIEEYGTANREAMVEVSKEIGTSDILKEFQNILGIDEATAEQVRKDKEADIEAYIAQGN